MKLNLGRDSEGQDFNFSFSGDADVWFLILKLMINRDSEIEM